MASSNNVYNATPQSTAAPPALPVASVLGMSSYLVASIYPLNKSSILGGGDSDLSRDSNDSVSSHIPFFILHLIWECAVESHDPSTLSWFQLSTLIDHGSPAVLIEEDLVSHLQLPIQLLPHPFPVSGAFFDKSAGHSNTLLTHWVKLKLHNRNDLYSTRTVRALVAPKLCHPVILGLPFLLHNSIVVDTRNNTIIGNNEKFDLLHPVSPAVTLLKPKTKIWETIAKVKIFHKKMIAELQLVCKTWQPWVDARCRQITRTDVVAAIRICVEQLAADEQPQKLATKGKDTYSDVFQPIPHV